MKGILEFIGMFAFLCLIGCILSLMGATAPIPFVSYVFWGSLIVMFLAAGLSSDKWP
jgi:Na+/citrate or Na+/malate symporter